MQTFAIISILRRNIKPWSENFCCSLATCGFAPGGTARLVRPNFYKTENRRKEPLFLVLSAVRKNKSGNFLATNYAYCGAGLQSIAKRAIIQSLL
ncbi:hypothetical protein AAKU58_000782 [Oxalobacteraceae bacterium GrIS 1.18]